MIKQITNHFVDIQDMYMLKHIETDDCINPSSFIQAPGRIVFFDGF